MNEEILMEYDKMLKLIKGLPEGMMIDIFPSRTLPYLDQQNGIIRHIIMIPQGLLVSKELYNYMKEQDVT